MYSRAKFGINVDICFALFPDLPASGPLYGGALPCGKEWDKLTCCPCALNAVIEEVFGAFSCKLSKAKESHLFSIAHLKHRGG